MKSITNYKQKNKRVLLRADLNLPLHDGKILDYTRLDALKDTIDFLLNNNHKIAICSHLGRPNGQFDPKLSLKILIPFLEQRLGIKIRFIENYIDQEIIEDLNNLTQNEIILLENIRFHKEEKENDIHFASKIARNFEVYVNDAFGVSHRSHASNVAITNLIDSYAGLLLTKEIKKLDEIKITNKIKKPLTLIIGGAKMKTKTPLLKEYLGVADYILIGGAIANTFLKSKNIEIGKSLYDEEEIKDAQKILSLSELSTTKIILPQDVKLKSLENKKIIDLNDESVIYDIGENTIKEFISIIHKSKNIIFNGPLGLYIEDEFAIGTKEILNAIISSNAKSYLGGGDTVDAIHDFNLSFENFTHVSTGGGAMLTYLEGKKLPALENLN